jgi:hypothetical protein
LSSDNFVNEQSAAEIPPGGPLARPDAAETEAERSTVELLTITMFDADADAEGPEEVDVHFISPSMELLDRSNTSIELPRLSRPSKLTMQLLASSTSDSWGRPTTSCSS